MFTIKSKTRTLTVLYVRIPCDIATLQTTDKPRIVFDTAEFSWSGKEVLAEESFPLLKSDILKTIKEIIIGKTSDIVVVLGWSYEKSENKHYNIEVNNTTEFCYIKENSGLFVTEKDLFEAKESPERELSRIFQKTAPNGAVNISGTWLYAEFKPDEPVIVIN
jgi:hypothetical protein